MHSIRARIVDVFAPEALAGAPTGIVQPPPEVALDDDQRAAVASELVPEATAVINAVEGHTIHIGCVGPDRPEHERLPLASLLAVHEGELSADTYTVETATQQHEIEITDTGTVWQTVGEGTPTVDAIDTTEVANAVEIDPSTFDPVGLTPAIATVGRSWLVLAVPYVSDLKRITPTTDLTDRWDVAGVYAMTFETVENTSTVHARAFIDGKEVPAVPSGAAAAGAYLQREDAVESPELRIEQGDLIGRAGRIDVRSEHAVHVGGRGVCGLKGTLSVPESGTDIIEV